MGTLWDGEPESVRREEMWFPFLSVLGVGKCEICLEGATGFEGNKQPENACMEGFFFPKAIGFVTALPHVWGCSNLVLRFEERFR